MSCTDLFWLAHDDTLENNFFENSFLARAHSGVNYAEEKRKITIRAGKMNAHLHARDSPRDSCQLSLTRGSVLRWPTGATAAHCKTNTFRIKTLLSLCNCSCFPYKYKPVA